ncbi:MAG: hypothetical protein QOK21_3095 [Solirubrobacteraceae bacterium]|nr:hypothetical protein [Solirubrobacteraceae bacterium]
MIPDEIADALIPAAAGMPSASEADADGRWLERVLAVHPDLAPQLDRIVASLTGLPPAAALERLEREQPDDLDTLLVAVAGAYYLSDAVRERLGYPGQQALGLDVYSDLEAYIEEGLLEPVLARGDTFRTAP